jgi:hypothetical protein
MKPACFNRKPFLNYLEVQIGWTDDGRRIMAYTPDEMSKGCQQHGALGEATLNMWDCTGCPWMPVLSSRPIQT